MIKLFSSRKGFNDVTILVGIMVTIFLTAYILTYINIGFDTEYAEFDTDKTKDGAIQDAENVGTLDAFNVLITVLKLSTWDVGDTLNLYWWIDLFYTILALTFIITIARNIWIGGGG